jgi:hypothetical protein
MREHAVLDHNQKNLLTGKARFKVCVGAGGGRRK